MNKGGLPARAWGARAASPALLWRFGVGGTRLSCIRRDLRLSRGAIAASVARPAGCLRGAMARGEAGFEQLGHGLPAQAPEGAGQSEGWDVV